jgi:hypothetical protein
MSLPEHNERSRRLQREVKALKDLVQHCWVHSGYKDCGFNQMTTEQKRLYCATIGRKEGENYAG